MSFNGHAALALNEHIVDVIKFWKLAFQALPGELILDHDILGLLPTLRKVQLWIKDLKKFPSFADPSVSLGNTTFQFSEAQWLTLVSEINSAAQLFGLIEARIPVAFTEVRKYLCEAVQAFSLVDLVLCDLARRNQFAYSGIRVLSEYWPYGLPKGL